MLLIKDIIPEKNTMIAHCPIPIDMVWNIPCNIGTYITNKSAVTEMTTEPNRYILVNGLISKREYF